MSTIDQALDRIEETYGVLLPRGYRNWSLKNYTNVRAHEAEEYLWISEAEWIPLDEVSTYDLWRQDIISGLIPFAFTGAGDNWCLNTQIRTGDAEYEVLCCWHDEDLADAYAPSFPAGFYRCCLNYASGCFDNAEEAREHLQLWSIRLAEIGPREWADHVASLARTTPFEYKHPKLCASVTMFGFLTDMEVTDWIAQQWGQRYIDGKVDWGHF